jgi:hypothetical protein
MQPPASVLCSVKSACRSARPQSNLGTTVQHLTNDITLATERNRALERRIADLECRLAERRASPDDIDKEFRILESTALVLSS